MSESSTIESILHRFLENRESLSDAEFRLLLETLRTQPAMAERLKDHLIIDELLAQQYQMDRKDFIGKFEERLRQETEVAPTDASSEPGTYALRWNAPAESNGNSTPNNGTSTAPKPADKTSRSNPSTSQNLPVQPPGHPWRNFLLVMLGLFLVAAGLMRLEYTDAARKIAEVHEVEGLVIIDRGDIGILAKEGMPILPGDDIRLKEDGRLKLTYRDQSRLEIDANSQIAIQPGKGNWPGLLTMNLRKEIFLSRGRLTADIAPQPPDHSMIFETPQLVAEILGTRLSLSVDDEQSRVEVVEGRIAVRSEERDEEPVELTTGHQLVASRNEFRVSPGDWPLDRTGLVFLLPPTAEISQTLNQGLQVFAEGPHGRPAILRPRGNAEFKQGRLQFRGGAFLTDDQTAKALLEACQKSNALSLEATFQTADLNQTGPARWITFSTSSHAWNVSLAQEGDQCVLRLLTQTDSGEKRNDLSLFTIPDDQPHHVVVTYSPGALQCYLDGQPMPLKSPVQGDFANWTSQHLLFGDEWNGDREWKGSLSGVAIYGRTLSAEEVARNALHFRLRFLEPDAETKSEE